MITKKRIYNYWIKEGNLESVVYVVLFFVVYFLMCIGCSLGQ